MKNQKVNVLDEGLVFEEYDEQFHLNFEFMISFWRNNIHRFIKDFFQIQLHEFQEILLHEMTKQTLSAMILFASRGLGKSFLTALYVCAMCVLYPGIKVIVVAPTVSQSNMFIKKIKQLCSMSPNLESCIEGGSDGVKTNKDGGSVKWINGSEISTLPCSDNARGARGQILVLDEFILMDDHLLRSVFVPMLTEMRNPPYLKKHKYKNLVNRENNVQISLSSIGTVTDWGYAEFLKYINFISNDDNSYFVASLPYQFGVESGIINKQTVVRQIKEGGSLQTFQQEMECIPFGEGENALFSYAQLANARRLEKPLIPVSDDDYIELNGDITKYKYYEKKPNIPNFYRVLVMDIAISAKKEADNSVIMVIDAIPTRNNDYKCNVRYIEIPESSDFGPQVLRFKQLYYDLECDYAVIDANGGLGLSFYDRLKEPTLCDARGIIYPVWKKLDFAPEISANPEPENGEPVVYGIKVAGGGASEMIYQMNMKAKIAFERNNIGLLAEEESVIDKLDERYNYSVKKLGNNKDREFALKLILPFANTTSLMEEAVQTKLIRQPSGRYKIEEGKVRKDRVITFMYGIYFIGILEEDLKFNGEKISYQVLEETRKNFAKENKKQVQKRVYKINNNRDFGNLYAGSPFGYRRKVFGKTGRF